MDRRWLALVLWALPGWAWAFQIETLATKGCHERLSLNALEGVPWPDGAASPAVSADDRTLASSVEFTAPVGVDRWTLAVLLGARDNDLHGAALFDLPDLVIVHNADFNQTEHCLRRREDDGESGDRQALAACRAFILSEVALALGEGSRPDLWATEPVRVALRWETKDVPLQRFGFHLGRAMHALEDSFAHAFRTDDERQIVSVLNWVDPALLADSWAVRDGWPHQSGLDACEGDDEVARRVTAATEAARALALAVAADGERSARLQAAGAVLDDWLGYQPGCDATNAYCGHARALGCSATGGAWLPLFGAVLWLTVPRRRRPGPRIESARAPRLSLLLGLGLALTASSSLAQELDEPDEPDEPEAAVVAEPEAAADVAAPRRFSVHAALGASVDRGGGTLAVGGGVAFGPHARVRLDVELNPWLDTVSGHLAPGALSAYGTFMWCWIEIGRVELASSVSLGASALLFRVPGADPGSVGLFAGASMLRVGVKLSEAITLEFNPEAVVAVPSFRGVPLAYRQYRATAGIRWDLGQ
jgi:hypothetical protein